MTATLVPVHVLTIPQTRLDHLLFHKSNALSSYQFGNKVAKHYFCNQCGNYTFHETMRKPGYFRVNLGCVDGVESFELDREVFNGKELL